MSTVDAQCGPRWIVSQPDGNSDEQWLDSDLRWTSTWSLRYLFPRRDFAFKEMWSRRCAGYPRAKVVRVNRIRPKKKKL